VSVPGVISRAWPAALLALGVSLAAGCKPPAEDYAAQSPYGPVSWQPGIWSLLWSDEFDGPADSAPDPTKWTYQLGGDGWGNKELQNYTDSLTNGALDGDGHLVITARAEMSGSNAYTSARLTTQGKFARAYGRFEARMKLTNGHGLWPAFWIMGDDIDTVGWPSCGELDIVEENGRAPDSISGSVHGPQAQAAIDVPATRYVAVPGGADADFHVYAVEWDPDSIVFLFDELPYFQITPPRRPKWVYDHPFFIIVNLAVGGLFPGPPNATTPFPASITVDWVRVSARASDGGTDDAVPSPSDASDAPPADDGADAGAGDDGPTSGSG
jgi:beta-glucanase (GH16 family)